MVRGGPRLDHGRRTELGQSFQDGGRHYQRVRPGYPAESAQWLVPAGAHDALDVDDVVVVEALVGQPVNGGLALGVHVGDDGGHVEGLVSVDDAVDFMKFLLSDEVQVEGYAKLLNLTTRSDMTDNQYFKAEPLVQDVAKALAVGQTPYTLTFFEQINSPQGPWLQMLQRVYYTDDPIDQIIADAKDQMKAIANQ